MNSPKTAANHTAKALKERWMATWGCARPNTYSWF